MRDYSRTEYRIQKPESSRNNELVTICSKTNGKVSATLKPLTGIDQCVLENHAGTAQDCGESGGYFWQRHDDDYGGGGVKFILPEIRHDKSGFLALIRLETEAKDCFLDDADIDMSAATWFDADMCAAFGAILYRLSDNLNTIRLTNICSSVEEILSKNGFLSHYGREKIPDRWGTTIPYRRFDVKDDRYFADYIENELIHRAEMPVMSQGLLKKFRESIFEIFSNAVLHSNSELGIFSCGQFFPNRQRLDFSVADLGIGMRQNI